MIHDPSLRKPASWAQLQKTASLQSPRNLICCPYCSKITVSWPVVDADAIFIRGIFRRCLSSINYEYQRNNRCVSKKHEFRLHTHQNHIVGFVSLLKKPSLRLEVTYAATYLEDLNSTLQLPYIFAANPPLNFQQLFRHGGWSDCRSSRRVLVSSSSCRLVTPIPPNGGLGVPKKPWFRFRNYSDFM